MMQACSVQLKIATLQAHRQTEDVMMPALKAVRNLKSYGDVLTMMYGFYKPLEERIRAVITTAILPDVDQRDKSVLAKNDVTSLGTPGNFVTATMLPVTNSIAKGFGALYVLEGSTLGGVYISRMLKKNKALQNVSLSFFDAYNEQTGPMWQTFKTTMDNNLIAQNDIDEAVYTANETFTMLQQWMAAWPKIYNYAAVTC